MTTAVQQKPSEQVTTAPNIDEREMAKRSLWLFKYIDSVDNAKLSPAEKYIIRSIFWEFLRKRILPSQLTKMWYPNIGSHCGLSYDAVGTAIKRFAKFGILSHQVKREKNTHGEETNRVYLAFTPEFLTTPWEVIAKIPEKNRGGKREPIQCPHCGEYHKLSKKSTYTCTGCGCQIDSLTEYQEIPNDPPSTTQLGKTEQETELARMDKIISDSESYHEAADIPDDIVDAMGGPQEALSASPVEIGKRMSVPRHEREGLTDEDMATVDAISYSRSLDSTNEPLNLEAHNDNHKLEIWNDSSIPPEPESEYEYEPTYEGLHTYEEDRTQQELASVQAFLDKCPNKFVKVHLRPDSKIGIDTQDDALFEKVADYVARHEKTIRLLLAPHDEPVQTVQKRFTNTGQVCGVCRFNQATVIAYGGIHYCQACLKKEKVREKGEN